LPLAAFAIENPETDGIYADDFFGESLPTFLSFTGEIVDMSETDWGKHIRVQNEEGSVAVFATDHNTHFMGEELALGMSATGFYPSEGIMLMIYPPQYPTRLVTVGMEHSVVLDRFEMVDGNEEIFWSISNQLVLNISGDTPIFLQDGQDVRELVAAGETLSDTVADFINGRKLVVTHSIANRMMPAGTIPADPYLTVTVLFEEAVHLPGMSLDLGFDFGYDGDDQIEFMYNYGISVEGRMVDALWQEVDGGFYVPFRAIVNLLRFGPTVEWHDETRSISVYNGSHQIHFALNSNEFTVGDAVVSLNHPAILIGNTTYVPFQFFSQVFGMNNAWMHAGQVFIDNYEVME